MRACVFRQLCLRVHVFPFILLIEMFHEEKLVQIFNALNVYLVSKTGIFSSGNSQTYKF